MMLPRQNYTSSENQILQIMWLICSSCLIKCINLSMWILCPSPLLAQGIHFDRCTFSTMKWNCFQFWHTLFAKYCQDESECNVFSFTDLLFFPFSDWVMLLGSCYCFSTCLTSFVMVNICYLSTCLFHFFFFSFWNFS